MLSSPADANTPGSLGDHLTQLTSAECAFCLVAARQNVDDGRLTSAFWCPSCAWLSKSLMALSPQPRGKQKNLWTSPCSCSLLSCAYSLILRSRMPAIILEGCLVHVLTPAIHSTFHFVQSVALMCSLWYSMAQGITGNTQQCSNVTNVPCPSCHCTHGEEATDWQA